MLDFLGVPEWLPRPGGFFARSPVATMHGMVARAIARRTNGPKQENSDMLHHMLAAIDPETGHRMSPSDLVHNMQFFIVAGHETTALAISWALYLLSHSPSCQERARNEAARQLKGRSAKAEDLPTVRRLREMFSHEVRRVAEQAGVAVD